MTRIVFFLSLIILIISCQTKSGTPENKGVNVDEKEFIELGGEKQYVEIKGSSDKNPVLLFIHGGPGWPQTTELRHFNMPITDSVTMVIWEQSGSGKSWMNNPNPKNLNLQQIIKDAHELTQILKKKFNQQKIYLAGYSWGSVVGVNLIQQYPEDYKSYLGIGQVVNIKKGMVASQNWLKEQVKHDKTDATTLSKLMASDTTICKDDMSCFMKQYELVLKYKGAFYNEKGMQGEEQAMSEYDDYKQYDWNKGFEYASTRLAKDMFLADFTTVKKLNVPVYLLLGRHDWNVPSVVAVEFLNNLEAPQKEVVWFENSGHQPMSEDAEAFNKSIIRICK
jgi:pimeloyl-ACP methyl ester carboxylesterase